MENEKLSFVLKIQQFFREIKAELNKVTWTGRKEVTSGAIAVVILSTFIALFLALIDGGLSTLVKLVLRAG